MTHYLGKNQIHGYSGEVSGKFVNLEGKKFYKIENVQRMRPFFMSIVSHADHWMFISSNGGVSAGRKDDNSSLFPYYTDDKITQGVENTGSVSLLKITKGGTTQLWEPFSDKYAGVYRISRNLYKNTLGNHLIFEEENKDLDCIFRYSWQFSDKYGFVRRASLENLGTEGLEVEILDGIRNIIPFGISEDLQNRRSNLGNAYKRSELHEESGTGIFSLTSMIVDKAEPSEALKASVAWSIGLDRKNVLLSTLQLDKFRRGYDIDQEYDIKAEPGAYLIHSQFALEKEDKKHWWLGADVNKDYSQVLQLIKDDKTEQTISEDLLKGSAELKGLVSLADGLQFSADAMSSGRHYSNVLFNIMRGGIFEDQYKVSKKDLINYLNTSNHAVVEKNKSFLDSLSEEMLYDKFLQKATEYGQKDLTRLAYEYLPLSFSRRHGDPSRPWNRFTIEGKNTEGKRNKNYEGNWRDIFQNWEALSYSFPHFLPSMITKFVNASTIDGYNPYRITRDGIDWEVIEPHDPWSYIGYWGDHQIIYLQKLLEACSEHFPQELSKLMGEEFFVYANVPYRIRSYEKIVEDPQDTIDFDDDLEREVEQRVDQIGSDGKLIMNDDGGLLYVNLTEKLLLTFLTKVSNFIPDAGIWLNTQRPEWNDANNALVGNGVSVVTLAYMYRYAKFFKGILQEGAVSVSKSLADFLEELNNALVKYKENASQPFEPGTRKELMDLLGKAGEQYRTKAYSLDGFEKSEIDCVKVNEFLDLCLTYFESTLQNCKRKDGLYHAYNLIKFSEDKANVDYLYEMLEGQVAILSAGLLKPDEALELLEALKGSAIYREDQYSYMLYPNRDLPGFLKKNIVPKSLLDNSTSAKMMVENGDNRVLSKDLAGNIHFNGNFHNADDLEVALNSVKAEYKITDAEEKLYFDTFELVFNHSAFTGRSGTFYGYEGLGSIYWHMVSKLLLAVQENIRWAGPGDPNFPGLVEHYYEIRAGIGINKSPELYGAFPLDPYSHTPWSKGAQQPGMTGQVKEDILSRWAELGVFVTNGEIKFHPFFLNPKEFLQDAAVFKYVDIDGKEKSLDLAQGQMAFTYCQVPVVYEKSGRDSIELTLENDEIETVQGTTLMSQLSNEIFKRSGKLRKIHVHI